MTTSEISAAEIPLRKQPRDWPKIALTIWGILGFAFLFFPIIVIFVYSFNSGQRLSIFQGFGFDAYINAFNNPTIVASVQVSMLAALGTGLFSAVIGSLGGIALARAKGGQWVAWVTGLLGLVMVTPEIVNAVSLLPWFVELGTSFGMPIFSNGYIRLIIGHSLFSVTVVTFIVRARMAGMNEALDEAAADLYATPWQRFKDITFPLIRPAVIAGALLAFTLSLDNTVLSSFISVAGATPWPVYVFSALRSALRPEIAAMATIMLFLTIAVLGIVALILRAAGRKTGDKTSVVSSIMSS